MAFSAKRLCMLKIVEIIKNEAFQQGLNFHEKEKRVKNKGIIDYNKSLDTDRTELNRHNLNDREEELVKNTNNMGPC